MAAFSFTAVKLFIAVLPAIQGGDDLYSTEALCEWQGVSGR